MTTSMRAALRSRLTLALRERDRAAATTLRAAIATIEKRRGGADVRQSELHDVQPHRGGRHRAEARSAARLLADVIESVQLPVE